MASGVLLSAAPPCPPPSDPTPSEVKAVPGGTALLLEGDLGEGGGRGGVPEKAAPMGVAEAKWQLSI